MAEQRASPLDLAGAVSEGSGISLAGRRLFFAIWPDAGLTAALAKISEGLPAHGGRAHHPADLHITLVFLGEIRPEQLPCVEQVADAIQGVPFTLKLDRVGYWPRPRIPWVGPAETPEPLQALVQDLQCGLQECGFKPERRPYKAHVTLARKARPIPAARLEEPLAWQVREFVLAASHSGPKPPRYEVLKRWPLGS